MNTHPSLERTETYLNLHVSHTAPGFVPKADGPFITISRESGAGGSSLARAIARRLEIEPGNSRPPEAEPNDWTIFNGSIIEAMLKTHDLPAQLARFLPEDRISEWNSSVGELVGLHPSLWDLVQKTNDLMRTLARKGRVILVGRGANFATAGIANGLHLRLISSAADRMQHMAQLYQLNDDDAAAHNAKRDAARRRYVRALFNADIHDPVAYDLIINTARLPIPEAADLVVNLIRSKLAAAS